MLPVQTGQDVHCWEAFPVEATFKMVVRGPANLQRQFHARAAKANLICTSLCIELHEAILPLHCPPWCLGVSSCPPGRVVRGEKARASSLRVPLARELFCVLRMFKD